jgi:peroxiredoxin
MPTSLLSWLLAGLLAFALACGPAANDAAQGTSNDSVPTAAEAADAASGTHTADDGHAHDELASAKTDASSTQGNDKSQPAKRNPNERPLPAFQGRTLDGEMISARDLLGQRLVLLFFNPGMEEGKVVARAMADVAKEGPRNNFRTVGVAVGSNPAEARRFATEAGLDFPVIDDSTARIANIFGLRGPLLLLGADREGYLTFAQGYFATEGDDAVPRISDEIATSLRIPKSADELGGDLIDHPPAPTFTTVDIDDKDFDFASLDGKPVVLVFFLHTCPHCHEALGFMKEALASLPEANRPVLLGVSVQNRPISVRAAMSEAGLDYFPILMDGDGDLRELYGVRGGVPDILLISADRKIVYRMQGWREDRDPPLMRMQLAKLGGGKVPMLLNPNGYTGNDACAVCHEVEAATWSFTSHARAYDTLVTHGADRDLECVGCHVVGFGEPGGYSFDNPQRYLEDVGCEDCHGRGGPHLSPGFVVEENYEPVCVTCHNKEHSLGFEYDAFSKHVSHAAIAAMSPEERVKTFGEGARPKSLMPDDVAYVGSKACLECHEAEYAAWDAHAHSKSIESLEAKDAAGKAACLECHTTGFDKQGGFDPALPYEQQPDLASVGCESCHGPGADHVAPNSKKFDTIISLGDKCDSCVILQICGACHDPENDPDFEFNVQDHIDRQRHGTTEAGTGKPLVEAGAALAPLGELDSVAMAERELARILRTLREPG